MKICKKNPNISPVGLDTAAEILGRLKKHVTDINGVTVQYYSNTGQEGLLHFAAQLNSIIAKANNGGIDELNLALGLMIILLQWA